MKGAVWHVYIPCGCLLIGNKQYFVSMSGFHSVFGTWWAWALSLCLVVDQYEQYSLFGTWMSRSSFHCLVLGEHEWFLLFGTWWVSAVHDIVGTWWPCVCLIFGEHEWSSLWCLFHVQTTKKPVWHWLSWVVHYCLEMPPDRANKVLYSSSAINQLLQMESVLCKVAQTPM